MNDQKQNKNQNKTQMILEKKLERLLVEYRMEKIEIIDGVLVFSKTVEDAVGKVSISWEAPKDKEE